MALAPPPSRIFSSSLRTCETRSAMNRILASKRADVGSTFEGNRLDVAVDWETSLRSAMGSQTQTNHVIPAEHGGANDASTVRVVGMYAVPKTRNPCISAELGGEKLESTGRFRNRIFSNCVDQTDASGLLCVKFFSC